MGQKSVVRAADAFRAAATAYQTGDLLRAEAMCRRTQVLAPGFFGASLMLGRLLRRRGAHQEAAAEFVRATRLAPADFESHHEAGAALMACGLCLQALGHLQRACAIDPTSFTAQLALGTALRLAGRPMDALPHYTQALRLRPDDAAGHNNLGVALLDLWRLDEALACFTRALSLAPQLADAHFNLANTLKELGRVGEAVNAYRRVLQLCPQHRDAHSNLLFSMMFDPDSNAHAILHEAQLYQARHLTLGPEQILSRSPVAHVERRLRIGYVCADFREHVFMLLLPQLILEHNRDAFEVFCYSNVQSPDAITQLYAERADHFRSIVALDDAEAAHLIAEDQIDVLVDITMHMAQNRLGVFARRPAPLQVTWLAYPGTTGAEGIDFRLSDPHLDPPGTDNCYSERTARLPETFWCYEPMISGLPVADLPAKAHGYVTFGCLNNFCKTNEETFSLWAPLLQTIATSRLLLLAPPGSARTRTRALFERAGVAPERIEFVDFQARIDYLKTYSRIDIALDTIPYNGHTTSLDAWWMGVPVLTLAGTTVVGRAGLSHTKNLGLEEMCAHTPEDFCARAVALSADVAQLAALRASLRPRMEESPLMNSRRFARHFEQVLAELFHDVCGARS